ncbi:MAG TPA: NBR1-Ig-like domain-containing protein [Anaerolineae bacterium]|nr:NBR1-Ig-like domain-containing protein [Anaerolineae bacterium]
MGSAAQYVDDITIPDNTEVEAGTSFVKTWRIKNTGDTTWKSGFVWRYLPKPDKAGNVRMTEKEEYSWEEVADEIEVKPGGEVNVSLTMIAPPAGERLNTSYWQFADPEGNAFVDFVYVQIIVTPSQVRPEIADDTEPVSTGGGERGAVPGLSAEEAAATQIRGRYDGLSWPHGRMLIGLHDRADRHAQAADYAIAKGKFDTIKIQSGTRMKEVRPYEAKTDFVLCRLYASWNGRDLKVEDFVKDNMGDLEPLVKAGVTHIEFHNEPNLTHEGLRAHGVVGSWSNGAEFANYFIKGRQLLRAKFPNIKVGFPGLSPGPDEAYRYGSDSGFRMNDATFLAEARPALEVADFICVHSYYQTMDQVRNDAINYVWQYRRDWPDKLLFVTEFSNPNETVSGKEKGEQAKEFYRLCAQVPGMGAAYYFIVSGSGWDHQALRREDGSSTGWVEAAFKE